MKKIHPDIYTFTKWSEKTIGKMLKELISEIKARVEGIIHIDKKERTFKNTIFAIESLGYGLTHKMLLGHILMNLSPKEKVRNAALEAEKEYERDIVDVIYDDRVYQAFSDYKESNYRKEKNNLSMPERKLLEDMARDYRNRGFELPKKEREKFIKLLKKQSDSAANFRFNINATDTNILCSKEDLKGLPENVIESLKIDKKTNQYIIPVNGAAYGQFMKYAESAPKRKEIAILSLQKGGKKNIEILSKLVGLRQESAKVLGYKNHIEATLSDRMAQNEKTATNFITDMYKRVEKKSKIELEDLHKLKSDIQGKKTKIEFYDTAYYANKLYERDVKVDTSKLKEYFECTNTVGEMLSLYSKLLGLNFAKSKEIPVWDKGVEVLKVTDRASKKTVGYIYMDLFPRKGKYSHAMVTHATNGYNLGYKSKDYMMPICALVCNFQEPTKKVPSLLSLDDVETLFHEFGHALHTVLTQAQFESQSGTNVTWDFVEAPSQMLENFIFETKNLKKISKHFKTGKSLDTKTIKKVIDNKNFMIASHISRQLMFCMFDFAIHGSKTPKDIVKTYNHLYIKIVGLSLPKETYFPAGFGHMDGYDAGYYSYMWSLVYAQDIYSKFKNAKTDTQLNKIGLEYRKKILEVGSSRDEMESVVDFLGRKPNTKAFFQSQGI